HHSVNAVFTADLSALLLALRGRKFHAAGGIENGAAPVDNIGNAGGVHIHNLLVQQTGISPHNSLNLQSLVNGYPDHRADRSIHARSIAAACQYSYGFNCLCHRNLPPSMFLPALPCPGTNDLPHFISQSTL